MDELPNVDVSNRSSTLPSPPVSWLVASTLVFVLSACQEPPDETDEVPTPVETRRELEPRLEQLRERVERVHADVASSIASHAPDVGLPKSDTARE
jgi:hypothetical protein